MPLNPDGIFYADTSTEMSIADITSAMATSIGDKLGGIEQTQTVNSRAERDLLYPTPVQGNTVFRNDLGFQQTYYNAWNAVSNPGGRGAVNAWYDNQRNMGLVPIVPPTVRVSGGTATANTNGVVSFSAATSIGVDNVFSSAYTNYKIVFTVESRSVSATANLRMTTAGTQTTGSLWYYGGSYWGASGSGFGTFTNASADFLALTVVAGYNNTRSRAEFTLSLKDQKGPLMEVISNDGPNGSGGKLYGGRWNDSGTNYDGFRINYSSGNITGTLQVFGYNE